MAEAVLRAGLQGALRHVWRGWDLALYVCRCRRRMAALAITVMAALAQPSGEQRHMPASLTQIDDEAACLLTQLLDMPACLTLPGPQWYPLPFPLFHPRTSRVPPDDR